MKKVHKNINYLGKDFNSFKQNLKDFSKTYYPNSYNDFTESSIGMLFIDMSAYVGDVLSFYLDNQIQETFIQHARQIPNLYNLSYLLGYTPKTTTVSSTILDFYQQLPAIEINGEMVPDYTYALYIPPFTSVSSDINPNIQFIIEDPIDFSISGSLDPTEVSVYQVQGNNPTYFLLKKSRKAISANINIKNVEFNIPDKFHTLNINGENIIGILDVIDSEGNSWYEVPSLAQDLIYDTIKNQNYNNDSSEDSPNLLQLKNVQRRFTTRYLNRNTLQIQFGAGGLGLVDEEIVPNPNNVGLGLPFEKTKLTTAFSPLNFVYTGVYGLLPINTTLTFRYLTGGGVNANVESNSLNVLDATNVRFINSQLNNNSLANLIFNSLAVNNPQAADGGSDGDTIEELRHNALGNFQTQQRMVTEQDYIIRSLSMPSNLGTIAKAFITPSKIQQEYLVGGIKMLDLYILSYNYDKKLRITSNTLKNNLKTYLSEYRIINDSINIKDAYIINIGVEFDIITLPNYNNNEVLTKCISQIKEFFNIDLWQINEPIILRDLYTLLDHVEGVQTVKNIKITNKKGESLGYSNYSYDIEGATLNNVVYPSIDPMIFELKYPETDIKGKVSGL